MPSVEMRRTTRIFGARVLRSGRRLLSTQEVFKHMRRAPLAAAHAEEDWIDLLDHGHGGGGGGDVEFKENRCRNSSVGNKVVKDAVIIDDAKAQKKVKLGQSREISSIELVDHDGPSLTENRRWGLVYSRKRTRSESINCSDSDKKFGRKFSRKQSGNKIATEDMTPLDLLPNITKTEPYTSVKSKSKNKKVMRVSVSKPTRLNTAKFPPKNGATIYSCMQKRHNSLRSRTQSNPLSPVISKSIQKACMKDIKELTQDNDSASCNASILVIESDRCRREVGAVITMEMVGSKQWFLVVKRNGVERFRVEALNLMRPCCCNRVTRAIIWAAGDESWKLEFPSRQDWFIFKELYRKCSERTVRIQHPLASIIPVPRVNEVSDYADTKYTPFKMPDLYISSRSDELSRTLETTGPVYDMDSDDDGWLNKFNHERVNNTRVDEDLFEKIIDAYERGIYSCPEDYSDATMVVDRCSTLASKDVLEAVYGYWITKRKKHSALVRVFQFYKPKSPEQLNFKSVLRKKRSFRQRGTQTGKGKQLTFLKAALYDTTNSVETEAEAENTAIKVEETEVAASWAEQTAVMQRERAQLLMEVADLLTYKAVMAVKIAETRMTSDNGAIDDLFLTGE